MSEKIVQLNEEVIKGQIKELVLSLIHIYSTENALKAGSGDSAEIVGLFSVEYGIYKEAIDTNAEITLSWGGKYTITANAKDIVKIDSVSDIAKSLNE